MRQTGGGKRLCVCVCVLGGERWQQRVGMGMNEKWTYPNYLLASSIYGLSQSPEPSL